MRLNLIILKINTQICFVIFCIICKRTQTQTKWLKRTKWRKRKEKEEEVEVNGTLRNTAYLLYELLWIISIKSAFVQNYIHTYYTIFSLWFFLTVYKWLVCWKPLGVDSFPHVYLSGPFHIWLNSCYVTCLNTFLFTMKTNQTKYHRKRYKLNIFESEISQHPACDKPEVQLLRTQWEKVEVKITILIETQEHQKDTADKSTVKKPVQDWKKSLATNVVLSIH